MFPRSPRLVSFLCFSTAPSRFLSSFPRKLRGNHQFTGSEAGLGPKSANSRQNTPVFCGYTWKTPVYLENTWHFAGFLGFASDILPQTSSRTQGTRELPEWSTKHPLVSLEISGNEKCWGPCRFLFGFRKHGYRPREGGIDRAGHPETLVLCVKHLEHLKRAYFLLKRSLKEKLCDLSASRLLVSYQPAVNTASWVRGCVCFSVNTGVARRRCWRPRCWRCQPRHWHVGRHCHHVSRRGGALRRGRGNALLCSKRCWLCCRP